MSTTSTSQATGQSGGFGILRPCPQRPGTPSRPTFAGTACSGRKVVRTSGTAVTLGNELDFGLQTGTVAIRVTSNFGSALDAGKAAAFAVESRGYRRATKEASDAFLRELVSHNPSADDRPRTPLLCIEGSNGSTVIRASYAHDSEPSFAELDRKYAEATPAPDEFFLLVSKK
jgi:hypothetical protein